LKNRANDLRLGHTMPTKDIRVLAAVDLQDLSDEAAALVLELPMRQLGGMASKLAQLNELLDYARGRGLALHLDAARLLEICPFYETSPKGLGELFDSVYLSC